MRKPKKFKDFNFKTFDDKSRWALYYGYECEIGGRMAIISGWKGKQSLKDLIDLRNYLNRCIKYIHKKQKDKDGR